MNRRKYSTIFVIATLVVALAGSAYALSTRQKANSVYPTNSKGQTYGSPADANTNDEIPDLMAAQATNGELGYLDYDEYREATRPASSREEALEIMSEYEMNAWLSFKDCVYRNTGSEVEPEGYDVLVDVMYRGRMMRRWYRLDDDEQLRIIEILPEGYRTSELAEEAWYSALTANSVSIPVYDKDGETIIGEFIIQ